MDVLRPTVPGAVRDHDLQVKSLKPDALVEQRHLEVEPLRHLRAEGDVAEGSLPFAVTGDAHPHLVELPVVARRDVEVHERLLRDRRRDAHAERARLEELDRRLPLDPS